MSVAVQAKAALRLGACVTFVPNTLGDRWRVLVEDQEIGILNYHDMMDVSDFKAGLEIEQWSIPLPWTLSKGGALSALQRLSKAAIDANIAAKDLTQAMGKVSKAFDAAGRKNTITLTSK